METFSLEAEEKRKWSSAQAGRLEECIAKARSMDHRPPPSKKKPHASSSVIGWLSFFCSSSSLTILHPPL
jgi:hypothetical protein